MATVKRWVKRVLLGLVGLVVLGIAGALIFIHTDYGREKIRGFSNKELAQVFTGGGSIGRIDGTPFGELILSDVVINGPDGKPAVSAKTVRVAVSLFDLVKHDIKLSEVTAEDVDIDVKREADGSFALAKLMKPSDKPDDKPSAWDVDLGDIDVVRAHIRVDTGSEDAGVVDLDDVVIDANAHIRAKGGKSVGLLVAATWRQRKAPISIIARASIDDSGITAPRLNATIGGIAVAGSDIKVITRPQQLPLVTGAFNVNAPKVSIENLVPRIHVPADIALDIKAANGQIALTGSLGQAQLKSNFVLDGKRVTGTLETNEIVAGPLTEGAVDASGQIAATFDVQPGAAGELPLVNASITGHGTYQQFPRTELTAKITTKQQTIDATLTTAGAMKSDIVAVVTRIGDGFHLDRGTIKASANPYIATKGKVRGSLAIDLAANGALTPNPDLAVKGTINGRQLRVQDASVATLDVKIDGTHIPTKPHGKANIVATEVVRGTTEFGAVTVDAHDRNDGKVVVDITSHPKMAQSLIEASLLVTPPQNGTLAIDLVKHHVRVNHMDWAGENARFVMDPKRFTLTNFETASKDGVVKASGSYSKEGEMSAKLDVENLRLVAFGSSGVVTTHVDVSGTRSRLQGTIAVDGIGLQSAPNKPGIDVHTKITLTPGAADVDASAVSSTLKGTAKVALAVPANPFDPKAWQLDVLKSAKIETTEIAFDPAMFERFGVTSNLRGQARLGLEVTAGLKTAKITADLRHVRGSPISEPISAHVEATLDGTNATGAVALKTDKGDVTLLTLTGKVPLTIEQVRNNPASLKQAALTATIELKDTSAPGLLGVFGRSEITGGTLKGKIDVAGTLGKPTVKAHITANDIKSTPGANGQPTPLMKTFAIDANYDGQGGTVTMTGAEDNGGTLKVVANLDPKNLAASTATIDAHQFDLKPLLSFAPDPGNGGKGVLDAKLKLKGLDPRVAVITGEIHLHKARLPLAPSIGTLRQGEIDIVVNDKQIKLDATGKLGKGTLDLHGTIAVKGVELEGGEATLTLKHVSPIGSIEPTIDAVVTTKMKRENAKWIADVTVDKGFVKIDKTGGEALKPVGIPKDLNLNSKQAKKPPVAAATPDGKAPAAGPPPESPGLIAHVTINPIKIEADEFRTTVKGKLDVTTDATAMGVKGSIEATSGDVDLFDRRYRLERAAVTFDGTIDPMLEVRIVHDFPDVTTITEVKGRLSKPELVMTSDPGMYSQSELLGFLLGGEPGGDPQSGTARDKAAQLGSSIVANQIGGFVKKALPFDVDVIRYEAATATTSAAITVGSWITHTLFFSFSQHLDARPDENSGEGTLEYWFTRRLELELTAGDRNYDGADLLWRKRY